jgi:hypothetical protein
MLAWLGVATVIAGAAVADYRPPRTSAGQPDLEGLWTTNSLTPFSRPDELKSLVLTESEAAEYEKKRRGKPPDVGENDVGAADSEWWETDVGLVRVRGRPRSSWIVSPPDGKPALTPAALAASKARREQFKSNFDNPEGRPDGERCLVGANAPLEGGAYNTGFKLVQTPGAVVILTEWMNDVRIVHMGEARPATEPRTRSGRSAGRWEGETLVIETTGYAPEVVNAPNGDLAADMRVIERITRISSGELHYAFFISNPSRYIQPIQGETVFSATAQPIFEFACHEGNYGLANVLAGGRAQDREQSAARP